MEVSLASSVMEAELSEDTQSLVTSSPALPLPHGPYQPASGFFYSSAALREICDIWDRYGSGLTNVHGSTGDLVLLGTKTDALEAIFAEYSSRGWDLGGSGSALRTPSCCVGPGRCEWTNYDTLDLNYALTQEFRMRSTGRCLHTNSKIKMSGCACDCVASIARADMSIIGTWKGKIEVNRTR